MHIPKVGPDVRHDPIAPEESRYRNVAASEWMVRNSLIEPIGMPEEWPRSYVQARLTAQRSIEYICREVCWCVDGLNLR